MHFARGARCEKCEDKQNSEEQVDKAEDEIGAVQAALQKKGDQSGGVREFFDRGSDDEGAEAQGIGGDDEEGDLPRESRSGEAVVEGGMGDRRRVFSADEVEDEIERGEDENAPDASDPESDLGELHLANSLRQVIAADAVLAYSLLLAADG